jgi:membrane-bound ClpP family serine protease
MIDQIFPQSVTPFEELIVEADPKRDLHMMLNTPGGDGETAVRLLRTAQSRCKELTLIVPDEAKSAGTLVALGAHHLIMGPGSDLGPIDPQMRLSADDRELVAAKDIVAAVDDAAAKVQTSPSTYTIYSALLSDVSAIKVQQARSAIARTDKLLDLALRANSARSATQLKKLKTDLTRRLIKEADYHGAIFGVEEAQGAGLPVIAADPTSEQWKMVWALWTRYFVLPEEDHIHVYEGERASYVIVH